MHWRQWQTWHQNYRGVVQTLGYMLRLPSLFLSRQQHQAPFFHHNKNAAQVCPAQYRSQQSSI